MAIRNLITNRIGRLRWRLTFTYTLATVGALLFMELLLLLVGLGLIFTNGINLGSLPPQIIEAVKVYHEPALRVILDDPAPDPEVVTDWLERFEAVPTSVETIEGLPTVLDAGQIRAVVLGRSGEFLGMSRPGLLTDQVINEPFDPASVPGSAKPLRAALAGEQDAERLYSIVEAQNLLVAAVPVLDTGEEQVLGVLLAWVAIPTPLELILGAGTLLLASTILFSITAAITGTGFGWLAARGLVRRLDRLTRASEAWSQGDFTAQAQDKSADELGQLARRLNEMAGQLQHLLATRRELVISEERNRLARDLHDSVKQQAFAAASQLGTARRLLEQDPQAAAAHVDEAQILTDDLRQELTSLIQELRPAALDDRGLVGAIHKYAEDWSKQNDITMEIHVEGERPLSAATEETLFRIFQEALANIAKHSGAKTAQVSLVYSQTDLTCAISDDGAGFTPGGDQDGFGLRSMRERVAMLQGTLEVNSSAGGGTRIAITVPNIESPAQDQGGRRD